MKKNFILALETVFLLILFSGISVHATFTPDTSACWYNSSHPAYPNWNITSTTDCVVADEVIELVGNLSIYGNLTFDNVTLIMNQTSSNENNITSYYGSRFIIDNSSNITTNNTNYGYTFVVDSIDFNLNNSYISWVNYSGTDIGPTIKSESPIIYNTTFSNNKRGIRIENNSAWIERSNFTNNSNIDIDLENSNNNYIFNNTFYKNSASGGSAQSIYGFQSNNTTVTNNTLNGEDNNGVAVYPHNSTYWTIVYNNITRYIGAGNNIGAVYVRGSNFTNISFNNFTSNNYSAISLHSDGTVIVSRNNSVHNNSFYNISYWAIDSRYSKWNNIYNNTLLNSSGIWFRGVRNCTVQDNELYGNYSNQYAIRLGGTMYNVFYNNIIQDFTGSGSIGTINLNGDSYNNFTSNSITNNPNMAISIYSTSLGNTFDRMNLTNISGNVYDIDLSNYNNVTNNILENSTGIYLSGSNFSRIENNTVNCAGYAYGIAMSIGDNTIFKNNSISNCSVNAYFIYSNSYDNEIWYGNITNSSQWDIRLSSANVTIYNLTLFNFNFSGTFKDVNIRNVTTPPPDATDKNLTNVSIWVNVTNTSSSGYAFLNITYNESSLGFWPETNLSMFKNASGTWSEVSGAGVNTNENYVYANITSFSIFAPMINTTSVSPPPPPPGNGGGGGWVNPPTNETNITNFTEEPTMNSSIPSNLTLEGNQTGSVILNITRLGYPTCCARLNITGIPEEWLLTNLGSFGIEENETKSINLTFRADKEGEYSIDIGIITPDINQTLPFKLIVLKGEGIGPMCVKPWWLIIPIELEYPDCYIPTWLIVIPGLLYYGYRHPGKGRSEKRRLSVKRELRATEKELKKVNKELKKIKPSKKRKKEPYKRRKLTTREKLRIIEQNVRRRV